MKCATNEGSPRRAARVGESPHPASSLQTRERPSGQGRGHITGIEPARTQRCRKVGKAYLTPCRSRRTPAGLAAEMAGVDHLLQQRRRAIFRIVEALVEHFHHRQHGVEPDQVGERQRADRVVAAELHAGIDLLRRRDAFLQREDRLVDHRAQDAVDRESPGCSCAVIETLPMRFAKASALAWVSSEVCRPRISSSSAITGTGLKKCMPMKRSGRSVAVASLVIEIEEVLVAISAPRLQRRAEILQDLDLQVLVLGRRLDHEVAGHKLGLVGGRR